MVSSSMQAVGPADMGRNPTSEVDAEVLVSVSLGSSELKESISISSWLRLRRLGGPWSSLSDR